MKIPYFVRIFHAIANQRKTWPLGQRIEALPEQVRFWISTNRNVRDLATRNPRYCEALIDRQCGKSSAVLDAAKSLLLERYEQRSVLKKRRRHVAVIGVDAE